jgi:hypothetical protein
MLLPVPPAEFPVEVELGMILVVFPDDDDDDDDAMAVVEPDPTK